MKFNKLSEESQKKVVAQWVVSTMSEQKVREKLAVFLCMGYDREAMLYNQMKLAYLRAVHNKQNVNTHSPQGSR